METKIYLHKGNYDLKKGLTENDAKQGVAISVCSIPDDVITSFNEMPASGTILSINIDANGKNMFMDVSLNEMELFARAILTQIEIIRRDCKKEIEYQLKEQLTNV
jgi:hypothetical protein